MPSTENETGQAASETSPAGVASRGTSELTTATTGYNSSGNSVAFSDVIDPQNDDSSSDSTGGREAGWSRIAASPPGSASRLAFAEPRLNSWLGRLFGPANRIRCDGIYRASPEVVITLTMQDLELSPADLLYLAGDGGDFPIELERLIAYVFWRDKAPDDAPEEATFTVDVDRQENWPLTDISMREAVEMARNMRRVILRARPLEARDLYPPSMPVPRNPDVSALEYRADALESDLWALKSALEEVCDVSSGNTDLCRLILAEAYMFGIPGAAPLNPRGSSETEVVELAEQVTRILDIVDRRWDDVYALDADPDDEDQQIQRIRAVLGPHVVVLPYFLPGNVDELDLALARTENLTGGGKRGVIGEWMVRMGKVRPDVQAFYEVSSVAEAYGNDPLSECYVLQLPYRESDDAWIGKSITTENSKHGRLSILAYVPGEEPSTLGVESMCGLLIDDWHEIVPSETEATGVAFNYPRPLAQAPQTILLAVAPVPGGETSCWSQGLLEKVLNDTLELAKIRTVDPDALRGLGQYLPALYLAENLDADTASETLTDTE